MAHASAPVMVFGSNRRIDETGAEIGRGTQPLKTFDHADVAMGTTPTPSQCMYRTEAARAAGGFDTALRRSEDPEFNMRLLRDAAGYCHGEMVADYRQHGAQETKRPARLYRSHVAVLEALYGPGAERPDAALLARARRHWGRYYGQFIPQEVARGLLGGRIGDAGRALGAYASGAPHTLAGTGAFLARRLRRR